MADSKTYSIEQSLKELGEDIDNMTKQIQDEAKKSLRDLQMQVHSKIVEQADKLKSGSDVVRQIYIKNLGMLNEGENLYVVYLKKEALWIEDGLEPGEMIDKLLDGGKPAKVSADGNRYKSIPFEHSKKPAEQSLAARRIAAFARENLKNAGLDGIIMNNGKPATGKKPVARLNVTAPVPGIKTKPVWRSPLLSGITVYQKAVKNASTGKEEIQKDVFTFRTVSESQKGSGLWVHPGRKALKAFEEVQKDVDVMWDKMIRDIVDQAAKNIRT